MQTKQGGVPKLDSLSHVPGGKVTLRLKSAGCFAVVEGGQVEPVLGG
jgi:hypothetical protein